MVPLHLLRTKRKANTKKSGLTGTFQPSRRPAPLEAQCPPCSNNLYQRYWKPLILPETSDYWASPKVSGKNTARRPTFQQVLAPNPEHARKTCNCPTLPCRKFLPEKSFGRPQKCLNASRPVTKMVPSPLQAPNPQMGANSA